MKADRMAAVLVEAEYPRDECVAALAQHFPDLDAGAAIDAALARKRERDDALAAAVRADERRARASEHDLNESIHDDK